MDEVQNKKRKRAQSQDDTDKTTETGEDDQAGGENKDDKQDGEGKDSKPGKKPVKRWDAETKTLKAETDFLSHLKSLRSSMSTTVSEMNELLNMSRKLENPVLASGSVWHHGSSRETIGGEKLCCVLVCLCWSVWVKDCVCVHAFACTCLSALLRRTSCVCELL